MYNYSKVTHFSVKKKKKNTIINDIIVNYRVVKNRVA